MTLERPPGQDIVIVGASGDLSHRKLLPALYNLHVAGLLPENASIIGFARTKMDDEGFRKMAHDAIARYSRTKIDETEWQRLAKQLSYVPLAPEGYTNLASRCTESQRLFYLATPPETVPSIIRDLAKHKLNKGARLVIEKPFGWDTKSARELNQTLHKAFDESDIFRIDHYLGKETVQNVLALRFANSVFERFWNRDSIAQVQVTVAESIGIEGRGSFYDDVGALRDIVQNHVLQMLTLLTMEAPDTFTAEDIRDEKRKLLRAVRPVDPRRVVRGQYTSGIVGGKTVPGYRGEVNVKPDSTTETFVALELFIDNWRWSGIPFYLRTGKNLPYRATEMEIAFKDTPVDDYIARETPLQHPNHLILRIQPDEAIILRFLAKVPGPVMNTKQVDMSFCYNQGFMVQPAEAYERLIHDVMLGDQTLFVREDAIERAWEIIQPILDNPPETHLYSAGTWGPAEADALIAPSRWHLR